ncbi:transposase [Brucella tritici]|uniref:Transposase n=1 Tax=Brucella tritici TaxID=94626 RepID=A0A833CI04_9HYPH|nr:transposase [Brucella tritici]KAB2662388.1 transposase [Brucella tritici]
MIGDRADAMLEDMDEARHEGKYRRIEVITGRRQRRNWTDEEKARILAESAEPDVNISAVARRRDAGLTSQRSARSSAQQAMFVPVTVVGDRTSPPGLPSDVAHFAAGRIEIEIAGARMTVMGPVAPELAQAMVAALRGRR